MLLQTQLLTNFLKHLHLSFIILLHVSVLMAACQQFGATRTNSIIIFIHNCNLKMKLDVNRVHMFHYRGLVLSQFLSYSQGTLCTGVPLPMVKAFSARQNTKCFFGKNSPLTIKYSAGLIFRRLSVGKAFGNTSTNIASLNKKKKNKKKKTSSVSSIQRDS